MEGWDPKQETEPESAATRAPEARVLVVDDNPMDALLCQRLLERHAFVVGTATDPRLALEMLHEQRFDLLLVDILMPHIGGFDLISQARSQQPNLAVLVMTSFGTVDTGIQALQRGVDGLILKPFDDVDVMVEAVRQALLTHRQKQDAARLQLLRPLFSITEEIIAETSPAALKTLILDSICQLFQAPNAAFFRSSMQDSHPELQASSGDDSLWNHAELCNTLLRLVDGLDSPLLLAGDEPSLVFLRSQYHNFDLGSFLLAPVSHKSDRFVFVAYRDRNSPPLGEAERDMFLIFARQAAIALENALLYEELRDSIRKVELSQRALVQAEKMAAAGRLMATVAHEINNPLQAVSNCLHLADRPDLDSDQRMSYLKMGKTELDRLVDIVQKMLDFYRPGGVERAAVDIQVVVESVIDLLRQQLNQKDIRVNKQFGSPLPPITAGQNQIQQVVFNLVLNAMDSIENSDGQRLLWIDSAAEKGQLYLWVEDSGPGIQPGMEQRIFEPFFSTKSSGTGLGLAVSYGIVEAHGGSLRVVSPRHGGGACFEVTLSYGSTNGWEGNPHR